MKLIAIILVLIVTGCTSTSYTNPATGEKFSRVSVLNSQSIGEVALVHGTDKLTIKGYQSEQTQAIEAVVGAAVKAAIKP